VEEEDEEEGWFHATRGMHVSIGFWVFIELGSKERELRREGKVWNWINEEEDDNENSDVFRWEDGKGGLYCFLPQVWLHIVPPFGWSPTMPYQEKYTIIIETKKNFIFLVQLFVIVTMNEARLQKLINK